MSEKADTVWMCAECENYIEQDERPTSCPHCGWAGNADFLLVADKSDDAWVESPATVQPEPQPVCEKCGAPLAIKAGYSAVLEDCSQCAKQPANTARPKPGADGYCPHGYAVAANCEDCFAERKRQRDEAEKQPANTAGEKWRILERDEVIQEGDRYTSGLGTWQCDCIYIGHRPFNWPYLKFHRQAQQPACPRCAELEPFHAAFKLEMAALPKEVPESYLDILAERDDLKAKCAQLEQERDEAQIALIDKYPDARALDQWHRIRRENEDLKAKCEALERGIKNQARVLEVCNQQFRDAAKQVEHLWPEAERPIGIQMICRKLEALEKALREILPKLEICSKERHRVATGSHSARYVPTDGANAAYTAIEQANAALAGEKK